MLKLGIDFGSTYTYIFSMDEKGEINDYRQFLHDIYDGTAGIPTQMVRDNGKVKIGAQAVEERRANDVVLKDGIRNLFADEHDGCGRTVRRSRIEASKRDTVSFFRELFNKMQIKSKDVGQIVCGMPATTATDNEVKTTSDIGTDVLTYSSTMEEIFAEVFADNWNKIEPVLACAGAIQDKLFTDGGDILVVDLGGGTNDFAYIKQTNGKYNVEACRGGKGPGGNSHDGTIQEQLQHRFGQDNFSTSASRKSIKVAKEIVFKGEEKEIDGVVVKQYGIGIVASKDIEKAIKLTYDNNIEDLHQDLKELDFGFNDVAYAVCDFCDDNDIRNINKVLFVGGCSNIEPFTEAIKGALDNKFEGQSLEYIYVKNGDSFDDIKMSNSNAVAYGALFYDSEQMPFNPDINRPTNWRFRVAGIRTNVDLHFEVQNRFSKGYFSAIKVNILMEDNGDGTYEHKIQFPNIYIESNGELKPLQRRETKESDRFHFSLHNNGKILPARGSYSIPLKQGKNSIVIITVHTKHSQCFTFVFNGKGDYEFPMLKNYKIDPGRTYIRGIIDGEDYIKMGKYKKLNTDNIKQILEDYSNGDKITV